MMDDVKLIALVSVHPEIYDVTHEKHSDIKYKQNIWMQIAEDLHLPPETDKGEESWKYCKNRWTNIRDQLTKCRRLRKISKKRVKPYKYEQYLTFMQSCYEDEMAMVYSVKNEAMFAGENVATGQSEDPLDETTFLGNALYRLQNKTQRNEAPTQINTVTETETDENAENGQDIHEIDAFLSGISTTLKKFPPFLQHLAKGRIFTVIHELEGQFYNTQPHPQSQGNPT